MPSPVRPSDFLDAVPSSSAGICEKFVKSFLRLPVLMYKLVNWMFNADGTFSDAAKTELGGGGTGGTVTAALSAPTNVAATDGTLTDRVTVSWSPVSGAAFYKVYRSESTDSAAAVEIASPTTTSYDDTGGTVGTHYFYFVKAFNAANVASPFSLSDEGFSLAVALTPQTFGAGVASLTIPVGWTTIDVSAYGAGASGGGSSYSPFSIPPVSYYGGGGGGSGERRAVAGIAVSAGQVIDIDVGFHGTCPGAGYAGQSGTSTLVSRAGVTLALARGGTAGTRGYGSGEAGTGGAGGAGGTGGTGTNGGAGGNGTGPSTSPLGGAGGTALDGYGAGGAGGAGSQPGIPNTATSANDAVPYDGKVVITPFA